MSNIKISKLMIWPSRKVNLGNYSTVDLSAGAEVVFDTPVEVNSVEVTQAYEAMRKVVKKEMGEQYKPFMRKPTTVVKKEVK